MLGSLFITLVSSEQHCAHIYLNFVSFFFGTCLQPTEPPVSKGNQVNSFMPCVVVFYCIFCTHDVSLTSLSISLPLSQYQISLQPTARPQVATPEPTLRPSESPALSPTGEFSPNDFSTHLPSFPVQFSTLILSFSCTTSQNTFI